MPKTNIDYAKIIIYKIINYDYPELVYVGSTTNFTKRKQQHKSHCVNINSSKYSRKLYASIRASGGWETWNMIKICDYPCYDKREAELEEDRHMMELESNLNMRRASRSMKQYYEDNKENIKDKKKQYYEDNKENIKDKFKQYYEDNKDKFKEYREDNKDKIKQYREDNKDNMKEHKSKKCTCECGSPFTHGNKTNHIKTIKHQKYLNTIEHINGVI